MIRPSLVFPAVFMTAAVLAQASNYGPFGCPTCGGGFDASAFNVVTLGTSSTLSTGNFNPTSDVGGGVAVFGSYTGNGYQIGSQTSSVPNPYTDNYAMIVNGSVSTNPFTVGNGGATSVWVGGTYGNSFSNQQQLTISQSPAALDFDFLAARTSLDNLSSNTLTNYTSTAGTPVSNGTNYVLTAVGTGLLVYNINASYFTNQNLGFEVDLSTGQSVIVNITGASSSFTFSKGTAVKYNGSQVNANTTGGVPVLFNLPEVTTLSTSNGAINGSILAPYASFSSNQNVDGQLFVASVTSLAETHDQYYNGLLPANSLNQLAVATPEPATLLLFGGALLAIGAVGRKNRR
ncbi:MAG: choice-of-anchor A family protein [Acidobacteriota bacterium]|nr:choice-of-anchor A family protein [Acidobacteriota bacterium]